MFTDVLLHIHTDSTGAKATATRTGLAPKTKHMQLRYLWIQNCFTTGMAKLHKIGTKENMPDVMTKYVTAEILRYLGAKIGLITTAVVLSLCADFEDYKGATEETDVTDNNNNIKPTIEHCKLSNTVTKQLPKRPYAQAQQQLPSTETVTPKKTAPRVQDWELHCPTAAPMATAYGFALLEESKTVPADCQKGLTAKATAKATATSTGSSSTEVTVHCTNGNWNFRQGSFHCDKDCTPLKKATTGVRTASVADCKSRNMTACKLCLGHEHCETARPLADLLSSTTESDALPDCENYMFSVTASTDLHASLLESFDTASEMALFKDCKLVYHHELLSLPDSLREAHASKTGYFWTVSEVPELRHLIKTGEYNGEAANWGNWVIWTDALSAVNHWLMRHHFGTESWKQRKDSEKHCLVGFKLDCCNLVNAFISKELCTFNRLHWSHSLTGKNTLHLSESEKHCITAFELDKTPTVYLQKTSNWVRHCQLSWDRTGTKPNWVCSDNTADWGTGNVDDTASPTSTAKMMPHWLTRSITAMKEALIGRND
jgi:hypothetical protein